VIVVLRSLAYQLYLYGTSAAMAVLYLPSLAMKPGVIRGGFRRWARLQRWGLRVLAGIHIELRGAEYLPSGPVLVAAKHQSMLETSLFFALLDHPAIILKKELTYIPLIGPLIRKGGLIVVDRKGGAAALKQMLRDAKSRLGDGHPVLIFPEGHRMAPGAPPDYQRGVAMLYGGLDVPCVPVALNSGLFWPRRTFLRYPGTVIFEFLPPIEPGLRARDFLDRLEHSIETATANLVAEGARQLQKNS